MNTALKKLPPSQAWEEVERRSIAFAVAGFVFVGALQAAGAIPAIYRQSLAPASGLVAAFLTALTLSLAYYHNRWSLGVFGTALSLILPYSVNLLWVRFTGRSLMYPVAMLVLLGVISLWFVHRRISGPQWEDDLEEALIQKMMEEFESKATWVDRAMWLSIAIGLLLLLVLLLR
jgi:hypothetical protein